MVKEEADRRVQSRQEELIERMKKTDAQVKKRNLERLQQ